MDEEDLYFEYLGDLETRKYYASRPRMFHFEKQGLEFVNTGIELYPANRHGIAFHKISDDYEEYKKLRGKRD